MKYIAWISDRQCEVEVELRNGIYVVRLDGKIYQVDARKLPDSSVYSMLIAGKSYEADVRREGDRFSVSVHGESYRISIREELWAKAAASASAGPKGSVQQVKAPMPGLVVELRVDVGEKVHEGQPLVVIEAMKMQNELYAQAAGVVKEVKVKEQETVNPDQVLMVVES